MIVAKLLLAALGVASLFASVEAQTPAKAETQTVVVAGGCFWCLEVIFEELKGVDKVESGYAGGARPNPTYEQVCTGTTGHAEVIKITFKPSVISKRDLLRIFFTIHDPTTLNRQGPDSGTQYRSAIFFTDAAEKQLALDVIDEITKEKIWPNKIVTTVEPLLNYTRAEEYHQDYYAKYEKASEAERMKMNAGYCAAIIEPKVQKFREKFAKYRKGSG